MQHPLYNSFLCEWFFLPFSAHHSYPEKLTCMVSSSLEFYLCFNHWCCIVKANKLFNIDSSTCFKTLSIRLLIRFLRVNINSISFTFTLSYINSSTSLPNSISRKQPYQRFRTKHLIRKTNKTKSKKELSQFQPQPFFIKLAFDSWCRTMFMDAYHEGITMFVLS